MQPDSPAGGWLVSIRERAVENPKDVVAVRGEEKGRGRERGGGQREKGRLNRRPTRVRGPEGREAPESSDSKLKQHHLHPFLNFSILLLSLLQVLLVRFLSVTLIQIGSQAPPHPSSRPSLPPCPPFARPQDQRVPPSPPCSPAFRPPGAQGQLLWSAASHHQRLLSLRRP